jgi:uncharacterized protein YjbI with pentapeptide repeats
MSDPLDIDKQLVPKSEFKCSDMSDSKFANVKMERIEFEDINMNTSTFNGVNLRGCKLTNVGAPEGFPNDPLYFRNCDFSGSTLEDVNLENAELTNCKIDGLKIDGVLVTDLLKEEIG